MKRRCTKCRKTKSLREVVTGGVSRGWFCMKHFHQYMDIIKKTMKEHGCNEAKAERIIERMAKKIIRDGVKRNDRMGTKEK